MTDYLPDRVEQAARIQEIEALIFDDQRARAEVNKRLDELEGAAIAGELDDEQIQQLRRLQARARLAGLRRRYL